MQNKAFSVHHFKNPPSIELSPRLQQIHANAPVTTAANFTPTAWMGHIAQAHGVVGHGTWALGPTGFLDAAHAKHGVTEEPVAAAKERTDDDMRSVQNPGWLMNLDD